MIKKSANRKKENIEEEPIRLQKFISMSGLTSRRKAETMILNKMVTVNGSIVTQLGTKVLASSDRVAVDGKAIKNSHVQHIYLMIYKPGGCLCTLHDDRKRKTVMDFVKIKTRVYPVGRLDYNSEGLLLLTNDGDFAHRLSHPKKKISKIYHVKVSGTPDEKILKKMKKGVLVDGVFNFFSAVKIFRSTGKNCWLTVTLHEGKNRQIRNVCEMCGHPVIKLKRVEYGGVSLGSLLPSELRILTFQEVKSLKMATGIKHSNKTGNT